MKKLLILGLVVATSMLAAPARADVDLRWGAGKPAVVIGTSRHNNHYHPPARHRHYQPPVRHRYYGPPIHYHPRHAHPRPHQLYSSKHYRYRPQHARPPVHRHHHGARHAPHSRGHGHWNR